MNKKLNSYDYQPTIQQNIKTKPGETYKYYKNQFILIDFKIKTKNLIIT